MQKWEYMYLVLNAYHQVIEVNGEKIASVVGLMFGSNKADKLWDALNHLGQLGWEVVGFTTWGEHGSERVLLKRSVQD
jgi:hypothetical protein